MLGAGSPYLSLPALCLTFVPLYAGTRHQSDCGTWDITACLGY